MKILSMIAVLSLFGLAASFGTAAPSSVASAAPVVAHEVSDNTLVSPDQNNNATPVCIYRPGACYWPDCTPKPCLIKPSLCLRCW
jgi:hypothetical protein